MKSTIDIESLRLFKAVVETGSFTAAGTLLEKDKAHLSRTVSNLEKRLGVQLLWRSTRRLTITEIGRDLYERAVTILNALDETEHTITRAHNEPVGQLRLTCGVEFGVMCVNKWIAEYMKRYPKVKIEAEYTNRVADIIHEGFDFAIRIGTLPDSDLSARTLGFITYGLYATHRYLKENGEPSAIEELKSHRLIMFTPRGKPHWTLNKGSEIVEIKVEPAFKVNNNLSARDIAAEHLGIVLLPKFQAEEMVRNKKFKHIMPEWEQKPVAVSAVFSSSKYMTAKVRAFIDLIVELWPHQE